VTGATWDPGEERKGPGHQSCWLWDHGLLEHTLPPRSSATGTQETTIKCTWASGGQGRAPGALGLLGILRVPALQVTQVDGLEGCWWTVWLVLGRGPPPHPLPTTRGSQTQVPWKGHSAGIQQKPGQLLQVGPTHSSGWGWGLSPHTPPLGTAHHWTAGCAGLAQHPARLQQTTGSALSSTQANRAFWSRARSCSPCSYLSPSIRWELVLVWFWFWRQGFSVCQSCLRRWILRDPLASAFWPYLATWGCLGEPQTVLPPASAPPALAQRPVPSVQ
jgi:hypothetical protein